MNLEFTNITDEQRDEVAAFMAQGMIDFGAIGLIEIAQNVLTILTTMYYSVVLDREFGFDATMVDKPIPVAQMLLPQEIAYKIALYEPRAQFEDIAYPATDEEGKLIPRVKIRILVTT